MNAQFSAACWPGLNHRMVAAQLLADGAPVEPLFGPLSLDHVQLVPQSFGLLDEAMADELQDALPGTLFRLHANVRVLPRHRFADLSGFNQHRDWFTQAASISKRLGAGAYSAHSGSRKEATFAQMLDSARRCEDLFECVVGVEGQYPTPAGDLLVNSWAEYEALFGSGVSYALDLSHINILAHHTGERHTDLLAEMLGAPRCLEVHVSDNDGTGDWHQVCSEPPWWLDLLHHTHPDAVIFSEGNHRRSRKL
ncbi:hypothetical protein [Caldimonas sp. KR1-144]|uniref:hypothetical protein n=1 Tax=Caldimonas sp. KR1-144 TaxID=3400911 RepID=UPI003C0BC692